MLHKKSVTCEKCDVTFAETPDFVRHYKSLHKNSKALSNENLLSSDLSQDKDQDLSKVSYQIASQEVEPGQMQNTLKEVSQSTDVSPEYYKTKYYKAPVETLVKESQNMFQDGSTDIKGQLSTAVSGHVSQDASVHVSQDASEHNRTQDMTLQLSDDEPEDLSIVVSQDVPGIVSLDTSGIVSQDASEIVSQDASESVSQDGTWPISQNASWHLSPRILSKIASEFVPQDVSGIVSQDVSREVEETKDCSQVGLQRCDICSDNFSDNDTYDTVAFQKHMKVVHQIDDNSYVNSVEANQREMTQEVSQSNYVSQEISKDLQQDVTQSEYTNQPKHQENSTSSTIQQNTNVLVIFFFSLYNM